MQALDTKRPVAILGKGDFIGICHLLSIQQVTNITNSAEEKWALLDKDIEMEDSETENENGNGRTILFHFIIT